MVTTIDPKAWPYETLSNRHEPFAEIFQRSFNQRSAVSAAEPSKANEQPFDPILCFLLSALQRQWH
jgi:hypothetical protein